MNTHKHRKMIGKIYIDNNVYSTDHTFFLGGGRNRKQFIWILIVFHNIMVLL